MRRVGECGVLVKVVVVVVLCGVSGGYKCGIHQKCLVKQHFWLRLWLWLWLRCGGEWGVLVNVPCVKVVVVVVLWGVSGCGVVVGAACW